MNVLIWNSWVTPAGGMERVALSLANGLAGRCGRVLLVGPYQTVPVLRERISPAVDFVPCGFARRPDALLRNSLLLRSLIRKHDIDVVSAHGSLVPLLPLSVPVVWTEHGPRYGAAPILQGARAVLWRAVQRKLRQGDWKLVGCSEFVRSRVCSELGLAPEKAAVIFNGLPDAGRLRNTDPPRFARPFKLGFLGRLEPEKYPLDIFAIDRGLLARGLACQWHVFGEGSLAAEMRRRASGEPRIQMRGLAKAPADALSQMDALVFLSHGEMEGLPTVILEARQARRPVIAWNVTANPEAAGPHDELVPPFQLHLFADAVARVLRRSETPPPPPEDLFSFDKMIERYFDVLDEHSHRRYAQPQVGERAAGSAS